MCSYYTHTLFTLFIRLDSIVIMDSNQSSGSSDNMAQGTGVYTWCLRMKLLT